MILRAGSLSVITAALPFVFMYRGYVVFLPFGALFFSIPILIALMLFVFSKAQLTASSLRWLCLGIPACTVGFFLYFLLYNGQLARAATFRSPYSLYLYYPMLAAAIFILISSRMITSKWGDASAKN